MSISSKYASQYTSDKANAVYPFEFVVWAFLGTYPGLHMPRDQYDGRRILDLGYGDGRNMPLLIMMASGRCFAMAMVTERQELDELY